MDWIHTVVLAVLQGFTEFLPISSSGHLILVPALLGWEDQGLAFDIAVHFGSLFAVLSYLRHDVYDMLRSIAQPRSSAGRLAWQVVAASVPLGVFGLIFGDYIEANLRSPLLIAATTIGFGLVLWAADRLGRRTGSERGMSWTAALAVGFAQALALVPGTSRSGITMTAALALGLDRRAAGRFAFILAIPAIVMASGWQALHLLNDPDPVAWGPLLVAATIAGATAFVTIAAFMKLIERIGMVWFMVYRVLLGIVIVYVFA
jgi:undecaprenyl-diphosphatase